jgi:hypothetical protein
MDPLDEWSKRRVKFLAASKAVQSNTPWTAVDARNIERIGKVDPYGQ